MSIFVDSSIKNQASTSVVETSSLAKRRLKVLNQTSASQIDSYERCPRIWANSYLFEERPAPSPAQQRGTDVDDNYVQPYLKTGVITQGSYTEILKAVIPFLPKPRSAREPSDSQLLIQHEIRLETFEGGPVCIGYMDFAELRPNDSDYLDIGDLKTTSDFRYCKTETELANNTQMIIYAQWGYQNDATKVSVAHVYGRTRGKALGHKVGPVFVSHVDMFERWAQRVETVREMVGYAATIQSANELTPDTSHCMDYGGCAFRSKCGFSTLSAVQPKAIKTGGYSMASDLLAQLRAAKGGGSNGAANGAIISNISEGKKKEDVDLVEIAKEQIEKGFLKRDPSGQVFAKDGADAGWILRHPTEAEKIAFEARQGRIGKPDDVLPSDAPSRTTTLEEIVAVEGTKRGRPKKTKTSKMKMKIEDVLYECEFDADGNELSRTPVELPKKEEIVVDSPTKIEKSTPVESVNNVNKLVELLKEKRGTQVRPVPVTPPVLFVDCLPVKGNTGTPLEEWLGPIAELAALANEVQDVRLISYTSKGVLASAIRDCLDTCPAVLLIDSRQFGADEVLAALIPHAALVVRGTR